MSQKGKINDGCKKYAAIFGILAVMLVVSNAIMAWFLLQNSDVEEGDVARQNDKYQLLNPARKLTKQEDLIINFQSLRDYISDKYTSNLDVSIYFEYLNTGASISVNKDGEFWGASLLKVPVAMAVAKKIEEGEWRWDNKLVLMSTDKDDKFGNLYKEKTGTTFTIEELVRYSLMNSDNTANFILLRNLEVEEVGDVYSHIGLREFLSTEGEISAKKYSVIFRALYNSSYLSEENSQKLISFLSETEFDEYLGSALPEDIIFAHKIGVGGEKNVVLDSGIIYVEGRPYLLTVMIKGKSEQESRAIMEDISKNVYNYVKDYRD